MIETGPRTTTPPSNGALKKTITPSSPADTIAVLAALTGQQDRVLGIVAGLDDEQLRRTTLPSGWSFAGMLRHLGLGTAFWCLNVVAGEPCEITAVDADFVLPPGPADAVVAEAATRMSQARDLLAPLPLETPVGWWPEGQWGGWRLETVQEVMLHLLVETSCHAGHLDAARELLDGRTWDYPRGSLTDPR